MMSPERDAQLPTLAMRSSQICVSSRFSWIFCSSSLCFVASIMSLFRFWARSFAISASLDFCMVANFSLALKHKNISYNHTCLLTEWGTLKARPHCNWLNQEHAEIVVHTSLWERVHATLSPSLSDRWRGCAREREREREREGEREGGREREREGDNYFYF